MDWAPTLLAMAGANADPAYPLDGISLVLALTENAAPMPRKLFWRYRFNAQRAMRDGDMKWLQINGNSFLFDVVADPLERANLKERQPEVYRNLVNEYEDWHATMLPEDPAANSGPVGYANQLADHPGITRK
jgi:arylsulfatase A-like enzyme